MTHKIDRLLAEIPLLHEAGDLPAKLKELTDLARCEDIKKADKPDEVHLRGTQGLHSPTCAAN